MRNEYRCQVHMCLWPGGGRGLITKACVKASVSGSQSARVGEEGSAAEERQSHKTTYRYPKTGLRALASNVGSNWQFRPQTSTATSKQLFKSTQLLNLRKWKAACPFLQMTFSHPICAYIKNPAWSGSQVKNCVFMDLKIRNLSWSCGYMCP
jgi:hypothetical protein